MQEIQIVSFALDEHLNTIEVVTRKSSGMVLLLNPPKPAPDEIKKHIFGVVDGKIKLVETKVGRHVPAQTIDEQFEF